MTLDNKGLVSLFDILPEKEFWIGACFRQFDVGRLDAKTKEDDYYDLMLIDISILEHGSIALLNVTLNSDNRGRIITIIPNIDSKYFVLAQQLQNYYSRDSKIYCIEDIELLYCKSLL